MSRPTLTEMLGRVRSAPGQSHVAKTVEAFGWLILAESLAIVFLPVQVMALLGGGALDEQATNIFRLVGMLVGGVGMLYIVSGRLNSQGFAFASLLDRPLVPFLMAVFWYLGIVPTGLAVAFALQDFGSFLWTLSAWRREQRQSP